MISANKLAIAKLWFNEYFTKGNTAILNELTAEDFTYHGRGGDSGREQMKSFMSWYREVFHDDTWELNDFIEQGEKLAVRYTGWMTYKGGWFNIPAENQRVKETGIMIFVFKDGKVSELWCENSDAAILYNLGALPKETHEVF
ncbi:ester cyclase [Peribacillus deserti]|uniref:Ester cyclase n=1 Tax=Peribacillus deserti TaxID=673318 RepID=A0A2N5M5J1_9BACI|nr:ester cyclase [Peribacillus deserti]PLT29624.1 hypothetical protein CUU66_12010 [Peribacillus deserti]